jgi:predicted nucleic acid-binding protein
MSILVVDASVAAKWFLAEDESAKAELILASAHELAAPALLRVEVTAAIVRRFRNSGIDETDAQRKLEHAHRFLVEPAFRFDENDVLLTRAAEIALKLRHALQDCIYIACAERHGVELVTADASLLKRAAPLFPFVRSL